MNFSIDNFVLDYYFLFIFILFSLLFYNYLAVLSKVKSQIKYILLFIRFSFLIILLFIFINPQIINEKNKDKTLSIVFDNSLSMKKNITDIALDYRVLTNKINSWAESKEIKLKYFIFGEKYESVNSIDNLRFNDKYTNFNNMLNNIHDNSIILTDGVSTYGLENFQINLRNKLNILGVGNNIIGDNDISIKLLNYEISGDSVSLNVEFSANLNIDYFNQNIYMSNSSTTNLIIGDFNIRKGYNKFFKNLTLSKSIIENNNILYIDKYKNETMFDNNSIFYSINNNDLNQDSVLFISGSISNNTKFIKQNLISDLNDYEITHLYRLKGDLWNKKIESIDFNNYDILILDNFPSNSIDMDLLSDKLENNSDNKVAYLIGPDNKDNTNIDFLNDCNCKYFDNSIDSYKTDLTSYSYNNKSYVIPPLDMSYGIICDNSVFGYQNGNSIISKDNNKLLIFIDDLYLFSRNLKILNNNKHSLIKLLFDDFIYDNKKYLELYSNHNQHSIGDTIKLYLQTNKSYIYDSIYVDVYNNRNNFFYNRLYNYEKIDDNLLLFETMINNSSKFSFKAFSNVNNIKINSSNIDLLVSDFNPEEKNIYLNSNLLKSISDKTGGIYSPYYDIDQFLDNIEFSDSNNVNYKRNNLVSYSYLFITMIFLLSLEWYLRNKIGLI